MSQSDQVTNTFQIASDNLIFYWEVNKKRTKSEYKKEAPVKKARTTINVEGTTTFCNELSKALQSIYLGDTCDENDNIKICNIDFFI